MQKVVFMALIVARCSRAPGFDLGGDLAGHVTKHCHSKFRNCIFFGAVDAQGIDADLFGKRVPDLDCWVRGEVGKFGGVHFRVVFGLL